MQKELEDARVEAVKSATEIINSISKNLIFKDLDLLLIDILMTPRELSFYSITDDWSSRDYRQVGIIYGGALAILSIILLATGLFFYLPLILFAIISGRYIHLRHQMTTMARSKACHLQTLKICKYLVLNGKKQKKKTPFKGMAVKYTMLKYIRDRESISGSDYLNMFTHIDDEVDFYGLLHGVIDDVLVYAVACEESLPTDDAYDKDPDSQGETSYEEPDVLGDPPEKTNRDQAEKDKNIFKDSLLSEASSEEKESNFPDSKEEDTPSDDDDHEADHAAMNSDDMENSEEDIEQNTSEDKIKETEIEEDDDFSLDDLDEDELDIQLPDHEDGEDDEIEDIDDYDDDVLEEIGLAEEDLK